ncbi:MAG: glycosyltransferase family 4 protein [Pseudomonadota bacterium]
MKIGLLTPGWPGTGTPNGIATSVRNLSAGLAAVGAAPIILGNRDGPLTKGIPFAPLPSPDWTLADKLRARLGAASRVQRRLQADCIVETIHRAADRHGLDAVIMEETKGWAARVAARARIPLIANLHGPWQLLSQVQGRPLGQEDHDRIREETRAFARVAGLMAPSQASMSMTDGIAPGTPRALIRNACPPGPAPGPGERRPGHVLFVGRVERLKGADTVLMAFERLATTHPEARLTFVGPDTGLLMDDGRRLTMDDAVATLAPRHRDRISYLGRQTPDQIAALRRTHPVALIASRFENLNYSMLEAIGAHQAIVGTDVGGPAEILDDDVTARLVPAGDAEAMADALARLLGDPGLQARLTAAALAMLAREFHPTVVAEQTIGFLERVLARPTHL